MKKNILLFLLSFNTFYAQLSIKGSVKDNNKNALFEVNIVEKGTENFVRSNRDGNFKIIVKENAVLVFSYVGFNTIEKNVLDDSEINVVLSEIQSLDEVFIVGTRNLNRKELNKFLPIDFIKVDEVETQKGVLEINQLLHNIVPSFNSNKQTGSDGADHIDPAVLRGLGPDQTLVLINGKRRHQTSLVNLFGTRGRGNTGTDLNAIPIAAIKRIEILKDGASAQYGSDAIAGVINIVLKEDIESFNGSILYGAYDTHAKGDFLQGTPNTHGNRLDENGNGNTIGKDKRNDGNSTKISSNYGVKLGENGGFANFTTEFLNKEKTLRPGYGFRKGFGEASLESFNVMFNSMIPISKSAEFYAFGGKNYRETDAYAFTRRSGARVVTSIYSEGFTPRITSNIVDKSICAGIKKSIGNGWKMDFSQTFGMNVFHYFIKESLNASLENASPTEFDAGGHSLTQNNTNVDFFKNYKDILRGFNLAFGGEFRTERFTIFSGEQASYATYDVYGQPITNPLSQSISIDPISNAPRPGGSQGFPGYSKDNEVDKNRSNTSFYVDSELDVSKSFLLGFATRYEKYSDFGNTLNGKLVTKIELNKNVNLRGSLSTGFRAPSLSQLYYNLKFTNFNSSGASEVLLSPNNSFITKSFGIDKLKQERTYDFSLGIASKFKNFTASIDGYFIKVKDRIVLTGYFDARFLNLGVSSAQFFANGVDTSTRGIDLAFSYKSKIGLSKYEFDLTGNINEIKIDRVNNDKLNESVFFGARDKTTLLASAPKNKFNFNVVYSRSKFVSSLSLTRYSKIVLLDHSNMEDVYNPRLVTDIVVSYQLFKKMRLYFGSNNLFNIYPTKQDETGDTFGGGYWDSVQMGFNGAYYYTRLDFKL